MMHVPDRPGLPLKLFFRQKGLGALPFPVTAGNFLFLNLGRNCIYHAISIINLKPNDIVLLPAYLDDTVIEPFLRKNIALRFYRIGTNLEVDFEDISLKIDDRTKALLAINYFGFPQPLQRLRKFCEEHNLYFIEDNAHGFLSRVGNKYLGCYGDVSILSFRKTIPLPDGAALVINNLSLPKFDICLRQPRKISLYWGTLNLLWRSFQLRYDIDIRPIELIFATCGNLLKNHYGNFAMSNLSLQLARKIDYDYVYEQRRDHFKFISQHMDTLEGAKPIYKKLPDGICPWGFPILVNNRDRIQRRLRRHGITLPIHWRLPHHIPLVEFPDSKYLSEHILTLPVFQGLEIRTLSFLLSKLKTVGIVD